MTNYVMRVLIIFLIAIPIGATAFLMLRVQLYRRQVGYNVRKDWMYKFCGTETRELSVEVELDGLRLPAEARAFDTGFLNLRIESTISGFYFDPHIEIDGGGRRESLYFERGASGARPVNISPFLSTVGRIMMRGHHVKWKKQKAMLRLWRNAELTDEPLLIVATHSDDAEIGTYPLFNHGNCHILTICPGNCINWDLSNLVPSTSDRIRLATRMRQWDSVMVPWMVGISPDRSYNLGFPDGMLCELWKSKNKTYRNDRSFACDSRLGSKLRVSQDMNSASSWEDLISNIETILLKTKPGVLVVPFPLYDNHLDHGFCVLAIVEALKLLGQRPRRFLMYINHGLLTEHWPFGPRGAMTSLPPNHDGEMPITGLWSREVCPEGQINQLLMLEAMHDIREGPRLGVESWRGILRRIKNFLGCKVHGMERCPNSYFRRGVRSNAVYYACDWNELKEATGRFEEWARGATGRGEI